MTGRRIRILADDQHPHLVEWKGKGAQHIRTSRQVASARRDFLTQKLAHLGHLVADGLECRRPAIIDEFTQRPGGHARPFANSTTVAAPARRAVEISWQSSASDHIRNAASSGKDISTTLSRSHWPSTSCGDSSAASNVPW